MDGINIDFEKTVNDNIEMFGSTNVEFSKPLLIMEALRICFRARAVEMRSGYINEKFDRYQNVVREVIPDSRKAFISSIKGIKSLLAPEAKEDKKFTEVEKKINDDLKKAFKKYSYKPYSFKFVVKESDQFKNKIRMPYLPKNAIAYMPELGSTVDILSPNLKTLISKKGGWDLQVDSYVEECISIYDKLFAELNNLVKRTGYFKKRKSRE